MSIKKDRAHHHMINIDDVETYDDGKSFFDIDGRNQNEVQRSEPIK